MTLNRYTQNCGCSRQVKLYAKRMGRPCCEGGLQMPPTPCCEEQKTIFKATPCFRPTCNITATTERFWLTFKNLCDSDIPLNSSDIFFYHQATGLLAIHTFDDNSFSVSLVDATREGAVIEEDSCVVLAVSPGATVGSNLNTRCIIGQFVAPALNADQTIYISNGSGIPEGSSLTFTWEGTTASYTVKNYISATGTTYAYLVTNTGSGLTPGTFVDGGAAGECAVPVEIITDVDFCDLSNAGVVDFFTGCINGSPRSFIPLGEGNVPVGTVDGQWSQQRFSNFDCCIYSDSTIKFSGERCTESEDTAFIRDTDLTCFNEAWDVAQSASTSLEANILGLPVMITAWDPDTRSITLKPTGTSYLTGYGEFIEFPAGTAICLGTCCAQCTNGPQTTAKEDVDIEGVENDASIAFGVTAAYPATGNTTQYLIGYNQTTGAAEIVVVDSTFNDRVGHPMPGHEDALLFRQKICNTSLKGCDQRVEIDFNYNLRISGLPANVRVFYEIGSLIAASATLSDNSTPNPFFDISSQAKVAGSMDGPSIVDSTATQGTNIDNVFPHVAGFFKDRCLVKECDCANQIVWFYLRFTTIGTVSPSADSLVEFSIRRNIIRYDRNDVDLPLNLHNLEGFNDD